MDQSAVHRVLRSVDTVDLILCATQSPLPLVVLAQTSRALRAICIAVRSRILSPRRLLAFYFAPTAAIELMRVKGRVVITGTGLMLFLACCVPDKSAVLTLLVLRDHLAEACDVVRLAGYVLKRRGYYEPSESALYDENNCASLEDLYFDHPVSERHIRISVPRHTMAHALLYQRSTMLLNAMTSFGLISLYPAALLFRGQSLILQYHSYATHAYRLSYRPVGITMRLSAVRDYSHPTLFAGPRLFGDRWCLLIPDSYGTSSDATIPFRGNGWSLADRTQTRGARKHHLAFVSTHMLESKSLRELYFLPAAPRVFVLRVIHSAEARASELVSDTGEPTTSSDALIPGSLRAFYDRLPYTVNFLDGVSVTTPALVTLPLPRTP